HLDLAAFFLEASVLDSELLPQRQHRLVLFLELHASSFHPRALRTSAWESRPRALPGQGSSRLSASTARSRFASGRYEVPCPPCGSVTCPSIWKILRSARSTRRPASTSTPRPSRPSPASAIPS